jgi:hypothetical protein
MFPNSWSSRSCLSEQGFGPPTQGGTITKQHSGERILRALRQAESGVSVAEISRVLGQVFDGQCTLRLQSRDQGAEDCEEHGGDPRGDRASHKRTRVGEGWRMDRCA